MKAKTEEYYDVYGRTRITEQGWIDLRNFCSSIVYKCVGAKPYAEDIISRAVIECAEAIPDYDFFVNDQLYGWLYWKVRGVISKEACAAKREIPMDFDNYDFSNNR